MGRKPTRWELATGWYWLSTFFPLRLLAVAPFVLMIDYLPDWLGTAITIAMVLFVLFGGFAIRASGLTRPPWERRRPGAPADHP